MKKWKTTAEQDAKAKINIRKYIQKHKNIVYTSDLPQVATYRTLKQGTKYYNVLTGKATFERPTESNIVFVPSGYPINFGYTHYDAETNTVCCGIVTVDTATDKPNTNNKREYTFLSRFFMTGGTKAAYNENGEHIKEDSVPYTYTYRRGHVYTYTHNSVKAFWNFISARSHMRPITASNSSNKHQNYGISGILQYIKVNALEMDSECNRFYHIGEWSQKAVRTSGYVDRTQEAIDYLTSQELPEIDVSFQAVPPRMETCLDSYRGQYLKHRTGIIFVQNNENFVVFRYYNNRNYSYWGETTVGIQDGMDPLHNLLHKLIDSNSIAFTFIMNAYIIVFLINAMVNGKKTHILMRCNMHQMHQLLMSMTLESVIFLNITNQLLRRVTRLM